MQRRSKKRVKTTFKIYIKFFLVKFKKTTYLGCAVLIFLYCNQDIRTNDDTTTHILEPLPYDFYIFCIIIFTITTYYTSVLYALLIYEKCYFLN